MSLLGESLGIPKREGGSLLGASFGSSGRATIPPEWEETGGKSRIRKETEALTAIPSSILKGLVEAVKDVPRLLPGGEAPRVFTGDLLVETAKSFGRTLTLENIQRAVRGETTFVEALAEDLSNVLAVVSGGATAAAKGASIAERIGAASAGSAARVAAKAAPLRAPLRTLASDVAAPKLVGAAQTRRAQMVAGQTPGIGLEIAGRLGEKVERSRLKTFGKDLLRQEAAGVADATRHPFMVTGRAAAERIAKAEKITSQQADFLIGEEMRFRLNKLQEGREALLGPASEVVAQKVPELRRLKSFSDPEVRKLLDASETQFPDFFSRHVGTAAPTSKPRKRGAIQAQAAAERQAREATKWREQASRLDADREMAMSGRADLPTPSRTAREMRDVRGEQRTALAEVGLPRAVTAAARLDELAGEAARPTTFGVGKRVGTLDERTRQLDKRATFARKQAEKAERRAAANTKRMVEIDGALTMANTPAHLQPLTRAVLDTNAELMRMVESGDMPMSSAKGLLEELPKTVPALIARLQAAGIEPPQFWSDFTSASLDSFATGRRGLGSQPIRGPGMTVQAPIHKQRRGILQSQRTGRVFGAADPRLSGAAAMAGQVAWESVSNSLVDKLVREFAIELPEGAAPPPGMQAWDPDRILRAPFVDQVATPGGGSVDVHDVLDKAPPRPEVLEKAAPGTRYAIPNQIAKQLERFETPRGAITQMLGRLDAINAPWTGVVLNLTPRWLVNNSFSGLLLSLLELGPSILKPEVWTDAYRAWRKTSQVKVGSDMVLNVPFGSVDARVIGSGFESIAPENFRKGGVLSAGRRNPVRHVIKWTDRLNTTTDNFFRTMVHHAHLRKSGIDPEALWAKSNRGEALSAAESVAAENATRRAIKAMVDFEDLTPLERTVVRRVVPFYTWQKGIMKLAMSLPIDHPLRYVALEKVGEQFGGFSREEREQFGAEFLLPSIDIGGGKRLATRGVNPFADAFSFFRPEGLLDSLSPAAEMAGRFALRAPSAQERFGPQELGPAGYLVPQMGLDDLLLGTLRELPPARLIEAARSGTVAGEPLVGAGPGQLGQFFGVTIRTPEDLKEVIERVKENRRQAILSQMRAAGIDPTPSGGGFKLPAMSRTGTGAMVTSRAGRPLVSEALR